MIDDCAKDTAPALGGYVERDRPAQRVLGPGMSGNRAAPQPPAHTAFGVATQRTIAATGVLADLNNRLEMLRSRVFGHASETAKGPAVGSIGDQPAVAEVMNALDRLENEIGQLVQHIEALNEIA